ncbi:MAG: hypothetical protein Q9Q40_07810 [Acidobacteriota bacterium]|nr:hypothetical protein [Acidobacteriota bacterium]MDQ7086551.1 hypothetical protein [Acidobacteriota bacterium]
MKSYVACLVALATLGWPLPVTFGSSPGVDDPSPAIRTDSSRYRPLIVFHDFGTVTSRRRIKISGVVFSRSSVDRVTLANRSARLRPAEPNDMVRFTRVPPAAREAPYRVYFEFPDIELQHAGANDLDIRALATDGRQSDLHRITVICVAAPPEHP